MTFCQFGDEGGDIFVRRLREGDDVYRGASAFHPFYLLPPRDDLVESMFRHGVTATEGVEGLARMITAAILLSLPRDVKITLGRENLSSCVASGNPLRRARNRGILVANRVPSLPAPAFDPCRTMTTDPGIASTGAVLRFGLVLFLFTRW